MAIFRARFREDKRWGSASVCMLGGPNQASVKDGVAFLQHIVTSGQALARERERRRREGAPDEVLLGVECDLAELLADYLRFELQSGHSEQGVACLQALVEFNCFAPAFPGP